MLPDFALSLLVRFVNITVLFVISTVMSRHFGSGLRGVLTEIQFIPTFLVIVCFKWGCDTASLIIIRRFKEYKDSLDKETKGVAEKIAKIEKE